MTNTTENQEEERAWWASVPREFKWRARDEDGEWWVFETKPTRGTAIWGFGDLQNTSPSNPPVPDSIPWTSTLSERPADKLIDPALLKEGGYFRTRDGRKAGPLENYREHWRCLIENDDLPGMHRHYNANGAHYAEWTDFDLVAPWEEPTKVMTADVLRQMAEIGDGVEAGEGWRLLDNETDFAVDGDEWLSDARVWLPAPITTIGKPLKGSRHLYRRRSFEVGQVWEDDMEWESEVVRIDYSREFPILTIVRLEGGALNALLFRANGVGEICMPNRKLVRIYRPPAKAEIEVNRVRGAGDRNYIIEQAVDYEGSNFFRVTCDQAEFERLLGVVKKLNTSSSWASWTIQPIEKWYETCGGDWDERTEKSYAE